MDCRANPATYRGRCQTCAPARERDTHPNKHIYSSKKWRVLRRHKLGINPICEWPEHECDQIATDVHHVTAIQDGGDIWALANLQALCRYHHGILTSREMASR